MEIEDLQEQLSSMAGNVSKLVEGLSTLAPAVQELQSQVKEIQAERASQKQAEIAAQSQEKVQADRAALLSDIKEIVASASVEAVNQHLPGALAKVINPSGQPARKSASLVQAAGHSGDGDTVTISAQELENLQNTAKLAKMRTDGTDSLQRLMLAEKYG